MAVGFPPNVGSVFPQIYVTLREENRSKAGKNSQKNSMSSNKSVAKARRAVRLLPTHPTPAAHTHTSGTALEHTLREHPGRQHAVWYYAREASRRTSRPVWPLAAPSDKTGR